MDVWRTPAHPLSFEERAGVRCKTFPSLEGEGRGGVILLSIGGGFVTNLEYNQK